MCKRIAWHPPSRCLGNHSQFGKVRAVADGLHERTPPRLERLVVCHWQYYRSTDLSIRIIMFHCRSSFILLHTISNTQTSSKYLITSADKVCTSLQHAMYTFRARPPSQLLSTRNVHLLMKWYCTWCQSNWIRLAHVDHKSGVHHSRGTHDRARWLM